MMATFMAIMIPRAAVCADRIMRGAATPSRPVEPPAAPVTPLRSERAASSCSRRRVLLPGRGGAGARATCRSPRSPGADHRDHRLHRRRQDDAVSTDPAARSTPPAGPCSSTASTCASSNPTTLWARIGLVPQRPYLFSGTVATQPALRQPGRRPTRSSGPRSRSPRRADFVARDARGARRADRPGRHERLRRPAPAARDRARAGAQARDLPVRRLVLGARPRHRRPAARRARSR